MTTYKRITNNEVYMPDFYKHLNKQRACFWTPNELNFHEDLESFNKLDPVAKRMLLNVLKFFATADNLVVDIIEESVKNYIDSLYIKVNGINYKASEIDAVYRYQTMMEDIHADTYARMIDAYESNNPVPKDIHEIGKRFSSAKRNWIMRMHEETKNNTFENLLLFMLIVEGIFFCGSFCTIFCFKDNVKNKALTQLINSNGFIARDEDMHVSTTAMIYNNLHNFNDGAFKRLPQEYVHKIFEEAVQIELEFIKEMFPNGDSYGEVNEKSMFQYIKFYTNLILEKINYEPLFYEDETKSRLIKNPFNFMITIMMYTRASFFEQPEINYQKNYIPLNYNNSTKLLDLTYNFEKDHYISENT